MVGTEVGDEIRSELFPVIATLSGEGSKRTRGKKKVGKERKVKMCRLGSSKGEGE